MSEITKLVEILTEKGILTLQEYESLMYDDCARDLLQIKNSNYVINLQRYFPKAKLY